MQNKILASPVRIGNSPRGIIQLLCEDVAKSERRDKQLRTSVKPVRQVKSLRKTNSDSTRRTRGGASSEKSERSRGLT